MLVLFEGGDVVKAKAEALRRAKGSELVRVGEGGVSFGEAMGYVGQAGMFAKRCTLMVDRPFDSAEGKAFVLDNQDAFVAADDLIIVVQPKVGAIEKKKLSKKVEVVAFEQKGAAPAAAPATAFALLDAYQAGDRKRTWVEYRTLIERGVAAEEIHGTLAWGLRGMVLAGAVRTPEEAGMKEYPFKKARAAVAARGKAQADAALAELTALYHKARRGYGPLELLLEDFLLKK